jgi:hypothetical protein
VLCIDSCPSSVPCVLCACAPLPLSHALLPDSPCVIHVMIHVMICVAICLIISGAVHLSGSRCIRWGEPNAAVQEQWGESVGVCPTLRGDRRLGCAQRPSAGLGVCPWSGERRRGVPGGLGQREGRSPNDRLCRDALTVCSGVCPLAHTVPRRRAGEPKTEDRHIKPPLGYHART